MKSKVYLLFLFIFGVACLEKKGKNEQAHQIKFFTFPSKSQSGEPFLFTDKDNTVYLSWVEKNETKTTLKFSSLQKGSLVLAGY